MPDIEYDSTDILAAAIIAAGMHANPNSRNWTATEIVNDAIFTVEAIKQQFLKK